MAHFDLTFVAILTCGILAYYALLLIVQMVPMRSSWQPESNIRPFFVIVIPACNEEKVLNHTLNSLTRQTYKNFVVMVMDDASEDNTSEVVKQSIHQESPTTYLVRRDFPNARLGKGMVLNHAYQIVDNLITEGSGVWKDVSVDHIVVCILDADGQISTNALEKAAGCFMDPHVGGVQLAVRIVNARQSLLPLLQDMEFVGFSGLMQRGRSRFGSATLGGNGQFTRFLALKELGNEPWTDCLCEDLDLSMRMTGKGWLIRFCGDAYVYQQGLENLHHWLRQRTRWVQGNYQCWPRLSQLFISRQLNVSKKIEYAIYLVFISYVIPGTACLLAFMLLPYIGIQPFTTLFDFIENPILYNITSLAFSFAPMILFVSIYQRDALQRLAFWELPAYCAFFVAYSYAFALCHVKALFHLATGRKTWVKTPRIKSIEARVNEGVTAS